MKIAGKRTGPAEIEALLLATGQVAEAAAIGVPDPIKGSAVVMRVRAGRASATATALRGRLEPRSRQGLGSTVPAEPR